MANIITDSNATPLRDAWVRFTANLGRRIEERMHVRSRRDEIEALEAKTDAELARLGLRRDQIASHVFRDLFYT